MNGKQVKRLRRLGLDTKRAKNAFHELTHDQKSMVLRSVADMQMYENLSKKLEELENNISLDDENIGDNNAV